MCVRCVLRTKYKKWCVTNKTKLFFKLIFYIICTNTGKNKYHNKFDDCHNVHKYTHFFLELNIEFPIYSKKQYNKNAPKISTIPDEIIPRLSICTAFGFKIIANTKDVMVSKLEIFYDCLTLIKSLLIWGIKFTPVR
ncbi:hypothetical protein [Moraxella lacunata]|uniref:hypothetical protein n=1 Tax=Moraxella lacunata TaxID=477 RepID=UPI003EE1CE5E